MKIIPHLVLFSTALLTPVTFKNEEGLKFTTGKFEFNMGKLKYNKDYAYIIIGYGAVTSVVFIFIAMIKSLGKYQLSLYFNIKFNRFSCFLLKQG